MGILHDLPGELGNGVGFVEIPVRRIGNVERIFQLVRATAAESKITHTRPIESQEAVTPR